MSPSGRDIFCLKNFDTFPRTPVHVSKINAVTRAQLTFQMLTLFKMYIYIILLDSSFWETKDNVKKSIYSKPWLFQQLYHTEGPGSFQYKDANLSVKEFQP